jgi:hypothetical protein
MEDQEEEEPYFVITLPITLPITIRGRESTIYNDVTAISMSGGGASPKIPRDPLDRLEVRLPRARPRLTAAAAAAATVAVAVAVRMKMKMRVRMRIRVWLSPVVR